VAYIQRLGAPSVLWKIPPNDHPVLNLFSPRHAPEKHVCLKFCFL